MSFVDKIKEIFSKKDNIPGLPENLNSVDELKAKAQESVSQETVDKVTSAIPGEIDDKIANQVFDQEKK